MADPTEAYVRPKGRPKVEKNPVNGYRKVSRVFTVDPIAAQEETVESKVFLPYGTSDPEYPNAKLVAQVLNPSEDTDKVSLSRIYMELPSRREGRVESEEPSIQILEGQRYVVVRKFVALIDFEGKNDKDSVKDLTLAEVLAFPQWKPPNPSISLGKKVTTYELPLPGDEKIIVFLGSREVKNYKIHCEITETYHSSDNVTTESQSLTKFGMATSTSVINPTHIPPASFDIGLSKQKIYTVVQYKSFPTDFKLLSEKESIRADGSRTLSRTYSSPKVTEDTRTALASRLNVDKGELTPEILLPLNIKADLPSVPVYETQEDFSESAGLSKGALAGFIKKYKWIISSVSVDVSNPRMDVWSITQITAGIAFWVTREEFFTRPGIVNVQDTDIVYEGAPMKVPLRTKTYVWYEMPGSQSTSSAKVDFEWPLVALSGSVTYSEGDTKSFDKTLNNYLRKGSSLVTFEAQETVEGGEVPAVPATEPSDADTGAGEGSGPTGDGPIKAKKFKGRAVTTSGSLSATGTRYGDWDITGKVLKFSATPVFNKQSNTIWKMTKTVIVSTVEDLYGG